MIQSSHAWEGLIMETKSAQVRSAFLAWMLKGVVFLALLAGLMALAAGRIWPAGWAFVLTALAVNLLTGVLLRVSDPDLLVERVKMQPGTKPWDRFLAAAMALLSPLVILLLAGLEIRFRALDGSIGFWNWVGLALVALSGLATAGVMLANNFFSATVRIQSERGHHVVDTGPYRLVRHPGYSSVLVYFLAMPLALGSAWAWAGVALAVLALVVRTRLEDHTLQQELPGYREYTMRTRYRLIPGIW
jgi:protein-S-isoprenylcysteine O-methyltransferase Ste14